MKRKNPIARYCFILLAGGALAWGAVPASAQSQTMAMPEQDDNITRRQVADFDNFLDKFPEIADQLRKDPSLVNNEEFVENHPALQQYLQQHPEVREQASQNPNGLMRREERFDRREDQARDRDVNRGELATMDRFMDSHPEIAEQLRSNPALVNDEQFVKNHPALQQFLAEHPGVREQYTENPNGFMRQEQRFDRREDQARDRDVNRGELASMDRFMDSHPEIAEQLRTNPELVNDKQFLRNHPALQQYLADHPNVREEYTENPNGFMRQEQNFVRREDPASRSELAGMDRFMDNHPEIAEQLRSNPALVNDKQFVKNHPALQQYLAEHPDVREQYAENPNGFMRQEQRFDQREGSMMRRDRDVTGRELSSFSEFLEDHNNIAGELSKNPSLANNQEYLENHPALRDYLKANPKVHEELSENPQSFLQATQQFNAHSTQTQKVGGAAKPK